MKKLLTFALATALCTPVFAQKMGSTNSDAPSIKQSIDVGGNSMSLNYTAITWASGSTMEAIMDKENGARMRTRVNNSAAKAPLATFKTSVDCTCGDTKLAAGEYSVYYTITEACEWQVNFAMGDKVTTMKLPLVESPEENKRLLMCLYAGEKGAGTYVAFGNQMCMLEFVPAATEKKKA